MNLMVEITRTIVDIFTDQVLAFLIKQAVYSSILAIVILPVLLLWKRRLNNIHLAFLFLILLRLIIPPNLSVDLSIRNLWEKMYPADKSKLNISILSSDSDIPPIDGKTDSQKRGPVWSFLFFILYLSGLLYFVFKYFERIRYYNKLIHSAAPIPDQYMGNSIKKWREIYGIKRKIRWVCLDKNMSPFTMGLFHPIIFVPADCFNAGDYEKIDSIIGHEMAHIKRYDHFWLWLQNMIRIVYFFHPIVWIVNKRIHLVRECICDQMVLSQRIIDPYQYGANLISVTHFQAASNGFLNPEPGFGRSPSELKQRIRLIMASTDGNEKSSIGMKTMFLMVTIFVMPMSKTAQTGHLDGGQSWHVPVDTGRISAGFGPIKDPFTEEMRFHKGIDIAATLGTKIYAIADGKVVAAVTNHIPGKGAGRYTVLQHPDNMSSFYSQMDTVYVKPGQQVKRGECIGRVGSSGRSTGPHLHFEIRRGNEPVNPARLPEFKSIMQAFGVASKVNPS
jgi:bla regulator protein BlaR1